MALHEEMVHNGNFLFRWRSYLPLVFLAIIVPELRNFTYLGGTNTINSVWEVACLLVSFFGLLVRCYTIGTVAFGTSGRNTSGQRAEELNTSGVYSVFRNPLYFGNFFIGLGIVMFAHVWWVGVLYSLSFWLYYERIILAEEDFLREKFASQYLDWSKVTPAFWPRLGKWRRPDISFSLRHALKREYSGLLAIIVPFTLLELGTEFVVHGRLVFEPLWIAFLVVGLFVYFLLRSLARYTRVLHVEGR